MRYFQVKGVPIILTCLWTLVLMGNVIGLDLDWTLDGLENVDSGPASDEAEISHDERIQEREATTLRCHRRLYKAKVEQKDQEGRRCWDTLALDACWGRCDSHEISEWKFPYKRSKHPVCGFGGKVESVVKLKYCDDGASPEARIYRHVRPLTCVCRACSSAETSCGWLPLH